MQIQNNFLQPSYQNKYSFSQKNNPQLKSTINFGNLTKVSYAVIDGNTVTNSEAVKDIVSQFVKQLNKYNPKDNELRKKLAEATKDYGYLIKRVGNNLVTGRDASKLATIWSQSGVSSLAKGREASNFLKELFNRSNINKIMLMGTSKEIKGKIEYDITNLFTTIY